MNFSFGAPFQFATKFGGHEFQQDIHPSSGRYHAAAGTNNFNQQPVANATILQQPQQFNQNPYNGQQPAEHSFQPNAAMSNGENKVSSAPGHHHHSGKLLNIKSDREREEVALNQQILQNVNQSWQTLTSANPTSTVDYSSHILSATLPISIQHFLKYSETIKKETIQTSSTTSNNNNNPETNNNNNATTLAPAEAPTTTATGTKKKKKKSQKAPKVRAVREKKPRPKPGEIRETKALDGSTLFCCPECQMAYPDRSLIEQHVISHAIERRFVCDICNAALKRKDHLTRHKLSHIPDRPHVCNICMKSFKRKEQLTLHIVIHSGEKKHVCQECGKGFYRKDHLRKHTRSHIARRVKSEVTAQTATTTTSTTSAGGGQTQPAAQTS